jgi:hypothetical protein
MHNKIRKILLHQWDPLQIGDNPNLADEYDEHIPQLNSLLSSSPDPKSVIDELKKIEVELDVFVTDQVRAQTAKELLELLR